MNSKCCAVIMVHAVLTRRGPGTHAEIAREANDQEHEEEKVKAPFGDRPPEQVPISFSSDC